MRRLLAINQGPREPVTNYYRGFVSTSEVIEEQWGKFYPEKLAVSTSDADKNITRDKYLSIIFLAGADRAQFGTLIENLNNSYLAGNDQYPVSLDGTLTLLPHYQGHRGGEHMDNDKNVSRETSFAQRKPRKAKQLARICCWNCNEDGHYQSDCPQKKKMHGTQMSEWYYMAMRTMNVLNCAFFSAEKLKECVGSMCHTIEQTDRQGYPDC
jgi:hypothetical protein